jgi:hypothetical protein
MHRIATRARFAFSRHWLWLVAVVAIDAIVVIVILR